MTDPIGSEPLRHPLGRRRFMAAIAGGLLAAPLGAGAQQAGKVYHIGVLANYPTSPSRFNTFITAMRGLGYVEGQNFVLVIRSAEHKPDRLAALAAELANLK